MKNITSISINGSNKTIFTKDGISYSLGSTVTGCNRVDSIVYKGETYVFKNVQNSSSSNVPESNWGQPEQSDQVNSIISWKFDYNKDSAFAQPGYYFVRHTKPEGTKMDPNIVQIYYAIVSGVGEEVQSNKWKSLITVTEPLQVGQVIAFTTKTVGDEIKFSDWDFWIGKEVDGKVVNRLDIPITDSLVTRTHPYKIKQDTYMWYIGARYKGVDNLTHCTNVGPWNINYEIQPENAGTIKAISYKKGDYYIDKETNNGTIQVDDGCRVEIEISTNEGYHVQNAEQVQYFINTSGDLQTEWVNNQHLLQEAPNLYTYNLERIHDNRKYIFKLEEGEQGVTNVNISTNNPTLGQVKVYTYSNMSRSYGTNEQSPTINCKYLSRHVINIEAFTENTPAIFSHWNDDESDNIPCKIIDLSKHEGETLEFKANFVQKDVTIGIRGNYSGRFLPAIFPNKTGFANGETYRIYSICKPNQRLYTYHYPNGIRTKNYLWENAPYIESTVEPGNYTDITWSPDVETLETPRDNVWVSVEVDYPDKGQVVISKINGEEVNAPGPSMQVQVGAKVEVKCTISEGYQGYPNTTTTYNAKSGTFTDSFTADGDYLYVLCIAKNS